MFAGVSRFSAMLNIITSLAPVAILSAVIFTRSSSWAHPVGPQGVK